MKPTLKSIIVLLCGIWSLGLGARYTLELYLANDYICIPRNALYGINLWFDFIPLFVFGLFTTVSVLRVMIKNLGGDNYVEEKRI